MPELRKHLRGLQPYPIPVKPDNLPENMLRLDANENFHELGREVLSAAEQACHSSQGYPNDFAGPLRQAIANVHDLDADRISCGRGAMELISLLVSLYLEPGLNAVVSQYGYLYFRTAIGYSGADIIIAPETSLTVDIESLVSKVDDNTRIIFVANPANPSGTLIGNEDIRKLRADIPDDVLLVLDEAYAEYTDPRALKPNFDLADSGNTVILRTFSKIYGLAGFRVGWGYFPEQISQSMRIIQQPNSVTHVSQVAAQHAMQQQDRVQFLRHENYRIREKFSRELEALGLQVIPSNTNFILIHFANAEQAAVVNQYLRDTGIFVRPMLAYGLPEYLRITIGNEAEMDRVSEAMGQVLNELGT